MITINSIKNTFQKMIADGVNIKKSLLWGYFFTDNSPSQLEKISKELELEGYKRVSIYQDKDGLYWLNIEKVEIHTPESLLKRCNQFYELAKDNNLESFDGYDVGNPDKNKPITEVK